MPQRLRDSVQIWRLARDLRLKPGSDPVAAIVDFSRGRARTCCEEFGCTTLTDLLVAAAARVDTLFIDLRDDSDLERVRRQYVRQGELAFQTLADQLTSEVFAITFRLLNPSEFERSFVSVIDRRGEKASRSYFSKWHEIAHLLTLTEQRRLKFCRTHADTDSKDPEEALMDEIAGDVGFFPDLVRPMATGLISFSRLDEVRDRLCPEASQQASLIGLVNAWPTACVLVQAAPGLRESERRARSQGRFDFREAPTEVLRAIHVNANPPAHKLGMLIPRNMRIPPQSAISRVFAGDVEHETSNEDLGWWEASNGRALQARPVCVEARRRWGGVDALILPR